MNAEILSVGTELLLGGTVNTDARDISLALAELGVNVYWHTVVGDNPARLTECLYRARNRADLIITTGGLGPTCDDLTKQTLARAFDRKLYLNEDALADIREYFAERGRSFTDNNLRQAYLPEGSIMLPNDCGTAPGCIIEDGPVRVVMLPGPPRECVTMLRNYVMPYLQKLSGAVIRSHMIRFFGIGESAMETRLRSFMDGANPTVAPYSREGECWVRVTAKGANEQECEALMEPVIEDICDKMGDLVYGIDCASLEERVLQLLQEKNTSLRGGELHGRSARAAYHRYSRRERAFSRRRRDVYRGRQGSSARYGRGSHRRKRRREHAGRGKDGQACAQGPRQRHRHRHHRLGRARRGRRGARVRGARLARRLLCPPSAMRPRAAAAHPAHRGQQRFGYDPAVSHRIGCIK